MPKIVPHLITARRNGTGKISKVAGGSGVIILLYAFFLYVLNHMKTVFTQNC